MVWKSAVWAGCLLPVLAGCGSVRNWTTGTRTPPASAAAADHTPQVGALAAWAAVRGQFPQRQLTEEFHDGFMAGYADYQNRGAAAVPPVLPPAEYTLTKKSKSENTGRDYVLGFRYGIDVATTVGGGAKSAAPAPRSVAENTKSISTPAETAWNKIGVPKAAKKTDEPVPEPHTPSDPAATNRPAAKLPKPELPVIPPFNPDVPDGGKLAPIPVPTDADRLPVPYPPLPTTTTPIPVPTGDPKVTLPIPEPPHPPVVAVPESATTVALPVPASSAPPVLPANPSVPSILENIPPIPFRPTKP